MFMRSTARQAENFIDTANFYTNGTSERFMGEFHSGPSRERRLSHEILNAAPGNDPNAAGNHRKSMMQAVEASLKRLRTNYIDLYWVHIWDGNQHLWKKVMRGLDDIVRQGKVLHVGISDAPAWWSPRQTLWRTARLDTVHRVANRVQPHGADGRARTDSHGESFEPGGSGLVSLGERRFVRQVSMVRVRQTAVG